MRAGGTRPSAAVLVILALTFGVALPSAAQASESRAPMWARWYNGSSNNYDTARALTVDPYDNVIVTGDSYRASTDADVLTIKYSPAGDVRWIRRNSSFGARRDIGHDVATDWYGNVAVTGQRRLSSGPAYVTIRYDYLGRQKWVAVYDAPGTGYWWVTKAKKVVLGTDRRVFVSGDIWAGSTAQEDILTIAYSPGGGTLWARRHDGPGDDRGSDDYYDQLFDMVRDSHNNVYIAGAAYRSVAERTDALVARYNSNGTLAWRHLAGGDGHFADSAQVLAVSGSHLVAAGYLYGPHAPYIFTGSYALASGPQWTKRSSVFNVRDVAAGAGGIYTLGADHLGAEGDRLVIIKYNSVGSQEWVRDWKPEGAAFNPEMGRPGWSFAWIAADAAGNIYAAATTTIDTVVARFDASGNEIWRSELLDVYATDMALGSSGVHLCGSGKMPGSSTSANDYVTMKFAK